MAWATAFHCAGVLMICPLTHVGSAVVGLEPGDPARQPAATPE